MAARMRPWLPFLRGRFQQCASLKAPMKPNVLVNPATGRPFPEDGDTEGDSCQVLNATRVQVDEAVDAARHAQPQWAAVQLLNPRFTAP